MIRAVWESPPDSAFSGPALNRRKVTGVDNSCADNLLYNNRGFTITLRHGACGSEIRRSPEP